MITPEDAKRIYKKQYPDREIDIVVPYKNYYIVNPVPDYGGFDGFNSMVFLVDQTTGSFREVSPMEDLGMIDAIDNVRK